MRIDEIYKDLPKFHISADGSPISWGISEEILRFIYDNLKPGMKTIETGSGNTTVGFAVAGTNHTCVTPSDEESRKIMKYCFKLGIKPNITFLNQSSDVALPNIQSTREDLDFIFIDGAHRFPFPFIDFHYTERRLKIGGILGLDDTRIPSVKILYDFLCCENEWQLIKKFRNTAFFERINKTTIEDWLGQKINGGFIRKCARRSFRGRCIYYILNPQEVPAMIRRKVNRKKI